MAQREFRLTIRCVANASHPPRARIEMLSQSEVLAIMGLLGISVPYTFKGTESFLIFNQHIALPPAG